MNNGIKLNIYMLHGAYPEFLKNPRDIKYESEDKKLFLAWRASTPQSPPWAHLVAPLIPINEMNLLKNKGSSLLLISQAEGTEQWFALTFGSARYWLKEDAKYHDFGIKVVLNSAQEGQFKRLNKKNISSSGQHSLIQSVNPTDIMSLGFNSRLDVTKNISAKLKTHFLDKILFAPTQHISGGESLSLTVETSLENIPKMLRSCYDQYKLDNYKQNFPWLDYVKKVTNKNKIKELDQELETLINNKAYDKAWLAVPDILEWESFQHFKFNSIKEKFDDISVEYFDKMKPLNSKISIASLKGAKVKAIFSDRNPKQWTVYKCLNAEITKDETGYTLNEGNWSIIDKNYYSDLAQYIQSIAIYPYEYLPNCPKGKKEGWYNEYASNSSQDFLLFDKEIINIRGRGRFEFCDIYDQAKLNAIHVKKYGSSSVLGHLFNQGIVSAHMFKENSAKKVINAQQIDKKTRNIDEVKNVIFAIISNNQDSELSIPLLAKIVLREAAENIRNLGYHVYLYKIFEK